MAAARQSPPRLAQSTCIQQSYLSIQRPIFLSNDAVARLTAALADRYRIERELGQGGMATVYLAEDLKHERKVAIKVLRPSWPRRSAPTGSCAKSRSPPSCSIRTSCRCSTRARPTASSTTSCPTSRGESLRERLAREGELPVHEAVRLHQRSGRRAGATPTATGVVHRDIKPDNVMLSGRHALVTDFGVAKAVSEATGRQPAHHRSASRSARRRTCRRSRPRPIRTSIIAPTSTPSA